MRSCSSVVRASSDVLNAPRALLDPCMSAVRICSRRSRLDAASSIRRARATASAHSPRASRAPGAPAASRRCSSSFFGPPAAAIASRIAGSASTASTATWASAGTRTATTRERIVGSSAPGSLDVRMIVARAGGSSSSFRKAPAASSAPSRSTIRSASPMMKIFPRAERGPWRGGLHDRAHRGDVDALLRRRRRRYAPGLDPLADRLAEVVVDVGRRDVRVLEPWSRKVPVDVGMRPGEGVAAMLADAAGRGSAPVQSSRCPSQSASRCLPTPAGRAAAAIPAAHRDGWRRRTARGARRGREWEEVAPVEAKARRDRASGNRRLRHGS